MIRRNYIRRSNILQFLTAISAFALLACSTGPSLLSAERPNILFIAVDDLRPELNCYGAAHIHSPNIDRLAATGLRLQRAYCQQSVCNPSRTSLMTGMRPDAIGVTGNHTHFRDLHPDIVTLPQHFKNNGYFAQAIGKLYHGVFPDGTSNTKWDTMGDPASWSVPAIRFGPRYYYTEEGVAAAQKVYQQIYKPTNPGPDDWTQKLVFGPATESPDVSDNTMYDGKVADAAIAALQQLKQKPEQPFFLAVGFIKPHSPYIAPKKYFDHYQHVSVATNQKFPSRAPAFAGHGSEELRRYTDQPAQGPISEEKQRRVRQSYYACVSYIDTQIGRVLEELDRLGLADNTIVSLYGDHGYHLGEQGLWGKTTNFELDTRVPLIVRAPGMQGGGKSSSSLVELVDLYPTLTELARLPLPDHLEGQSFAGLLHDPLLSIKSVALSQYPRGQNLMGYSMRTPSQRFTQWVNQKSGEVAASELYTYGDSEIETVNLVDQTDASTLAELSKQLFTAFGLTSKTNAALAPQSPLKRKLKIACVGDSITFGTGIENRDDNSYPALLQKMLGAQYEVGNFGFSGATLLKKGHKPYWEKPPYAASLKFNPDIVVINLGANDVVDTNWQHADEFANDYAALIQAYRDLPSQPRVYICEITPIFPNHGRFAECSRNRKQLTPLIQRVAKTEDVKLIDLFSPFSDRNELYPDGLHPDFEGAKIMAEQVFVAVIGKQPPLVKLKGRKPFLDPNGTSFESLTAGEFETADTEVGVWTTTKGKVLIDNRHAKSGRNCLQLAGGTESVVELKLADGLKTDGQLSFWAERWTTRAPFSFRIEKRSAGRWSEIFIGDQQVRVGRSFLSNAVVPLGGEKIESFRFTATSPPNTGVLIDDLKFAPAQPQKISQAEVIPLTLPALVGTKASALLKLRVDVLGSLEPLSITNVDASLAGTTDLADVESVQVFYSGGNSNFSTATKFGESVKPKANNEILKFAGQQTLADGENYFWIACNLKATANIDHFVGALVAEIKASNGESIAIGSNDQPSVQRMGVAVRSGGDGGVHTFRIPGLTTTNDGTLIGVYDIRRRSGGDLPGDIDVGMSRSTDGGQTWEPMQVIMDTGDDPKFSYDGIGDPTVMVDKQTGTIWCGATWSHGNRSWVGSGPGLEPIETGQFMLVRSDDDGANWSQPINITKQVKNPEWCFLLQGPGKGITMSDGTIVMPAQYQDPPNSSDKVAHRLPHSTFIYSRDHGKSWTCAMGAFDDTTESQVVELNDGEIMINCRYNREGKRVVMTTKDMGKTWTEHPTNRTALIEPGSCMASLINVGRETGDAAKNELLLFSNPNSAAGRSHITIKASTDAGNTWPEHQQVLLDEQRGGGYSCLTMIDENTVGILFEGSQAHMTFQRFPLAEILGVSNGNGGASFQPPPRRAPTRGPQQENSSDTSNEFSFARVFGDHMVLQANQPIRVWGTAQPGSEVRLSLYGSQATSTADSSGSWRAEFPAMNRNATPAELIAISNQESITINDVLIGEVWFCAGQSNMEWPLKDTDQAQNALQNSSDPQLRLMNFVGAAQGGSGVYGPHLLAQMKPEVFSKGQWKVSDAAAAQDFSGVGFYFAQQLRKELDCPIGVVNVSIGGTPIEAWISESSLGSNPKLATMVSGNWLENGSLDDWCKTRARDNLKRGLKGEIELPTTLTGPNHSFKPGFMYASAVAPFAPMSLAGVLWYQGESNGDTRERIEQYNQAFPLLVSSWRDAFENPTMPVAFVQLPAMGRPNWPLFREYQRRSLSAFKNVGMAVTIDTGHPTNVHPTNKRPVGERLARWVLVSQYGQPGWASGPQFQSKTIRGRELVLTFDSVGKKLKTLNGEGPTNFEVAGSDAVFYPAVAKIEEPDKIVVQCSAVSQPVHARYAWAPYPASPVNLSNSAGLPAGPFTTEEVF